METPKYEGTPFTIEGTEYIVPALKTSDFRKFFPLLVDKEITSENLVDKLGQLLNVVTASLRRNYPELTEEFLGDALEPMQLYELVRIVASRSGLKPAKPGE